MRKVVAESPPNCKLVYFLFSSTLFTDIYPFKLINPQPAILKCCFRILLLINLVTLGNLFANSHSYASDLNEILELPLHELAKLKVITASKEAESWIESPVPITIITQKMILRSSATNLRELLLIYVPGMTDVEDQNEINIAQRGIYTSSQQKILFLLDGHRLNSRSYSLAAPDLSMSLTKIQQIEVLRGPASSLYGNVALTAVINIIPKTGLQISGLELEAKVGNHGQRELSLLHGFKTEQQIDWLTWFNGTQIKGENIDLDADEIYTSSPNPTAGTATLNGFENEPSYDIGTNIQSSQWQILINARQSHYKEPFSGGGITGEPYHYADYELVNGFGPGLGYKHQHFNSKHRWQLSQAWEMQLEGMADHFHLISPIVTNPTTQSYAAPQWREVSWGAKNQWKYSSVKNSLIIGLQFDAFRVKDAKLPSGTGGNITDPDALTDTDPLLPKGIEQTSSVYLQHKHYITPNWISNLGFRFDYKHRKSSSSLDEFSPRLGGIYTSKNFNLKLSYAESFVDATYWNRFSNLNSFIGDPNLKPERLKSLQVTPTWFFSDNQWRYSVNLFYNEVENFIFRNNLADAGESNYSNSGELKSTGIEKEISYQQKNLEFRSVIAWQRAVNSEAFFTHDSKINNVPTYTANLILDWDIRENLCANFTVTHIGDQLSSIQILENGEPVSDPFPNSGVVYQDRLNEISSTTLMSTNWIYKVPKSKLRMSFKINNLFDAEYLQGGSTTHPYPKPGRWFLLSLHLNS